MTWNVALDFAFEVENCRDPEGETITPKQIRQAIANRLASLTDEQLKEAVGFCDSYPEQ